MKRFSELLKQMNERLDLPQPTKSRILLEIASDLEDLYQLFLKQGLSRQDALKKAEEKFDVSDEALQELVEIHESTFRKLLGRISEQAQTRWERIILIALMLFVAGFSRMEIFSGNFFRQASGFVWPIVGLSFGTLVLAMQQIYKLYIKKDHDVKKLHDGLPWLLALGGASVLVGIYGWVLELYRSVLLIMGDVQMMLLYITRWAISCSAMMIVSLFAAIMAGLAWFILTNKVKKIEIAEVAWLLDE